MRHAGQVLEHRKPDAAQLVLVTHTGEHQHLGRVGRTQRQNDFGLGIDAASRPVMTKFDADRLAALDDDPLHDRTGEESEVGAVHQREGI